MLNFFQKPFGLDISNFSIELISLGGRYEAPKLLAMGSALLEEGIFQDGQISNKDALKKAICNLLQRPRFGKVKTKKVIFSLPESKSFLHILDLPDGLRESELVEFIRFQARENFPYPLQELYFDYEIQGKEVFLVAAPKNIVAHYLEVFRVCKLQPVALEIESISLGRALIEKKYETTLIIDIGAEITNFCLFDKGGLKFSESLPVAGNKFTQALTEKMKLSFTEAEELKKKIGFDSQLKKGRVFLILQKEIQPILEEIRKISDYFREKTGREMRKIIVGGGSSATPHLLDYLKENVEIPLALSDPWVKIDIDILKKKEYFKQALALNPLLYAPAIGSALRGLLKEPARAGINLLPSKGRN